MADRHILDASAVLCLLDDAPGADRIAAVLDTASISSVSVALVAAELTRRGADQEEVGALFRELHLNVIPFGLDQALDTGTLGCQIAEEGATLEHWVWNATAVRTGATPVSRSSAHTPTPDDRSSEHAGQAVADKG